MAKSIRKNKNDHELGFTIIDHGTSIDGDLVTDKNVRLVGRLKGNCFSKSKIIIAEKCIVLGNVKGAIVEVYGRVKGDIEAENRLFISSSGSVEGDCKTNKLKIEEGALIHGFVNKFHKKKVNNSNDAEKIVEKVV